MIRKWETFDKTRLTICVSVRERRSAADASNTC